MHMERLMEKMASLRLRGVVYRNPGRVKIVKYTKPDSEGYRMCVCVHWFL